MNKVILMGRLTRDPDIRYSQGERQMAIARYTLAVDQLLITIISYLSMRMDSMARKTWLGCVKTAIQKLIPKRLP